MREKLLAKLRELGVTQVDIEYSGYGDSGQVEDVVTTPAVDLVQNFDEHPHPWNGQVMTRSLKQALEDWAWELAYSNFPGFENNEGGQGTINWDIAADKVTLDHGWNIMEVDHAPTMVL